MAHRRELAHGIAVHLHRGQHCVAPRRRAEVPAPPGHLDARGEPLHVPLERAGEGLVEVVHVEHERPLGRAEPAEVEEVRVAA